MEKIRVIISTNGNDEFVIFTYEFNDPASDFIRPDCRVITDQFIEWDEPKMFPVESILHKI